MGILGFLKDGGSGLITGIAGTIAGAVSSSKDRDLQRELQQQQMEYGREMYALQSSDEDRRMQQQNEWNKEAAAKSQEYAKEMFDYTGYENQVKQMKAAGLNPALLNGGSGSPGQAHGATVNPATAMQPMGLQAAAIASQINLNDSQAEKNRADAKKTAGVDTDLQNANIDYVIAQTSNEKVKKGLIYANTRLLDAQEELQRASVDYTKQKAGKENIDYQVAFNTYDALVKRATLMNFEIEARTKWFKEQAKLPEGQLTVWGAEVEELQSRALKENWDRETYRKEVGEWWKMTFAKPRETS